MHISDSHCEIVKFSIYVVVIFVFRGVFFTTKNCFKTFFCCYSPVLASVVQKVDNAIGRINHYPADKH